MGLQNERSYVPAFDIPEGFDVPRTGTQLIERVSKMTGAMRALHRMTAESDNQSSFRMVTPSADIAMLPGNLQTPAFAHRIIERKNGAVVARRGAEIRLGRSIMLLEKGVKQNLVMRGRGLTHDPARQLEIYGRETLTEALEYALRATEEHADNISLQVLLDEEKVAAIGSIIFTNRNDSGPETIALIEAAENNNTSDSWHYRVDNESIPDFESHQQSAFNHALSIDDSRLWLESTLQAYRRM